MQGQEVWTVVAAVLAVAALLGAAVLARRMSRMAHELQRLREATPAPARVKPPEPVVDQTPDDEPLHVVTSLPERRPDAAPQPVDHQPVDDLPVEDQVVVTTRDGRTVVLPTHAEVVDATMGRPLVRTAVVGAGVWHALRPESRDRIRGIVRREFRRRKRLRQAAGRRAARTAPVDLATSQAWLGSGTPRTDEAER
ncbi:hypothetical protein [Solicola sp. PLA-1-18]|uniref:hypothetical protein n=1 Tax=Solicola sp. PLA-1-18 TaxID=3380532 RepID=UPI003B75DCD9